VNFIVYDIEATCWPNRPARLRQETIELGAFKLSATGEHLGTFQSFVRPIVHPMLSPFCKSLTSIDQVSINRAPTFDVVCEDFLDFIGYYDDEEYLLCSWGNFDSQQLQRDCKLHELDDLWVEPSINLKQQYQKINRLKAPRGLAKSVRAAGYEWIGDQHRAIDDARNTTNLFLEFIDEWQY
jgi:inhibitor of KinA sporulation pathway (predicted exonuclease)